jgi:hypothetical protein
MSRKLTHILNPTLRRTHGKRSTYIITLQNVNEAHRLARYLNMMDFKSDKSHTSQTLLRAQVLW